MNEINLLELFSGIGGFSKGIQDAGFKIKKHYFSEIDKHAIANYKYNFKDAEYLGSVTDVHGCGIEHPDIITFGSPCQDFSLAGKQLGMSGKRSVLILEAIRIIAECEPSVFIWENVKGAFSSNSGADFWGIIAAFANIGGYRLEWQLLNTSWFLPQNRERIYLIGHLAGRSEPGVFPFTESNCGINERATNAPVVRAITAGGHSGGHHSGMTLVKHRSTEPFKQGSLALTIRNSDKGECRIIQVNDKKNFGDSTKQQDCVYNTQGIMATLGMHRLESKVNIIVKPVLTVNREEKRQNGRRFKEDKEPAFTLGCQDQHGVMIDNNIRRLTEIECERLQGFPDKENYCIFALWKENIQELQKRNVQFVEDQNHKLQKSALIVENKELNENVLFVGKNLNLKNLQINKRVQLNVVIDCEALTLEIHNQEKLLLNVNIAEKKKELVHHIKIEDFVLLNVLVNSTLEQITTFGKAELHQNEQYLIHQKNGKKYVNLFGKETMQCVQFAEIDLTILKKLLNATISDLLNLENQGLNYQTLFLFVIRAIIGYIPKEILSEDLLTIEIKLQHGWTKFGNYDGKIKEIPKTQRYKMCGNAVTTNVVKSIVERLKLS